jgi:GDP-4-dehydro-6-deoxy-D-mannose reductase
MNALVTGASGFVGRQVCGVLVEEGASVSALPTRGVEPRIPALIAFLREAAPDLVFHLAGKMSGGPVSEFWQVNVLWAAVLLDALEAAGLRETPVLLVGTAAEYGMVRGEDLPVTEDHPCDPVGPYGTSKRAQTALALDAARSGRRIVVARPANVIGPGLSAAFALASFASQIAAIERGDRPPTLEVGNLDSARDFVDVRDVAPAVVRLARNPQSYGKIVNISSGRAVSIRSALDRLVARSRVPVEVRVDAARYKAADVSAFAASPARLRELVGPGRWRDLDDTLEDMLAHARAEGR